MVNNQVISLGNFIQDIFGIKAQDTTINSKFLYALKRNREIIGKHLDGLREKIIANKPTPEVEKQISEFEQKRIELCNQYSEKNAEGQPIIENQGFKIISEKQQEFDDAMKKLTEEYPAATEAQTQQRIFEQTLLLSPADDIEFYKIKKEYLPDTGIITPDLMNVLHELIEE